ncbi:MAG TPA: hypothetical protein VG055_15045 [Planctomycetaceae bacterium]|jgi:transposase InsO family protein|nr:hypothetical protein [Planctomycetaceae bacterium]
MTQRSFQPTMRVELPVGLAAAERMQNQCFTRRTNAFSRKWENHELTFALFVAWYNFCRPHMTFKTTPAVAAGLTSEAWTMERLLSSRAHQDKTTTLP